MHEVYHSESESPRCVERVECVNENPATYRLRACTFCYFFLGSHSGTFVLCPSRDRCHSRQPDNFQSIVFERASRRRTVDGVRHGVAPNLTRPEHTTRGTPVSGPQRFRPRATYTYRYNRHSLVLPPMNKKKSKKTPDSRHICIDPE